MSCGSWDYTVQGFFSHKCGQKSSCSGGSNFSFRYFWVPIAPARAWDLSLSWKLPIRSPRLMKYKINLYWSCLRMSSSSDYPPSVLSLCNFNLGVFINYLPLIGHAHLPKQDPRPNIQNWAFIPTSTIQSKFFSHNKALLFNYFSSY